MDFNDVTDFVKENPWKTGGGTLAIFYALSKMFGGKDDNDKKGGLMSTWKGKTAGFALGLTMLTAVASWIQEGELNLDNVLETGQNISEYVIDEIK